MKSLTPKTAYLTASLLKLGLSEEEITLYLVLIQYGPLTYLEASRIGGIERTKLYRLVNPLVEKGLIEKVPEFNHQKIRATDIENLERLIKERELEAKLLVQTVPAFLKELQTSRQAVPESTVTYYRGKEGIKQMTWNSLRANGLLRCYSYRFWDDILGHSFVMKVNAEMSRRAIAVKDLYSDEYLEFKKEWFTVRQKKPAGDWSMWDSRYLSEKTVKIDQNIDIYNDVVAYYYWQDAEIFGVEIQNHRVARLQKQIHDVLWKMAVKRSELDWTNPGSWQVNTT